MDGEHLSLIEQAGRVAVVGASPELAIEALSERLIRVRVGGGSAGASSYLPARDWAQASTGFDANSVCTARLAVRLVPERRLLEFGDDAARARLRLELTEIEAAGRLRFRFEIVGEQHFYGLGQGGQPLDRLGAARRLWNCHVNHGPGGDIAIPLIVSHLGYGLFFDNPRLAYVDAGKSHDRICLDYEVEAGPFDLYYLGGDDLRDLLLTSADLLGHAPMPPRWALGYMQSTRHFEGAEEVRGLAKTLREQQFPCDALIFLSTYGDGKGWNRAVGRLDYEPTILPEAAKTFTALREQGFRIITHEYPAIHEDSPLYAEAKQRGFLLDDGYDRATPTVRPSTSYYEGQRFIDFAQTEAGAQWWGAHRQLVADGVEGWWLDGGEGPTARSVLARPGGPELHNRYDLFRQQAFADGEARENPERRLFLLCRSGGAGMQRFGAGCWSGDINNTWATLEAQASLGLNMGLSGVALWGTDIGGFYAVGPQTGELFVRWFQFGAFNPIMRCHGQTWRMHVPWAYGPEVTSICRQVLGLRYRLTPYTYTLAWQAHTRGLPLMRPLVLSYPDDPEVLERSSEFLWGDDLLVAPVTRGGARHWPLYLPKGAWHDFWTGEAHDGGQAITAAAPLDRLPLFVRAGAIIPLGPVTQNLKGYAPEEITILVYPEAASSFTLYEDDGETNAYRNGHFALTEFTAVQSANELVVDIAAPVGDRSVLPATRTYTLQIYAPDPPKVVVLDNRPCRWRRDGAFLFVTIDKHPTEVRIAW
jgi:alpha-glucosidase (family GH31 glycosyl hydrolase)